jgi:type II secretion system protein N
MTPRVKKWVAWTGYPLAYLALLACFARVTFPFDRLRDRIVSEFNTQQGPSSRLKIGDMSGYWLSGVEANSIAITQAPKQKQGEASQNVKPKVLKIDSAHINVSLLRLLIGTVALSFGADAFGGQLSGMVANSSSDQTFDLSLESLNVGQMPILDELVGLPMKGSLDGQVELALAERKWANADGKLNLLIGSLKVGDGKAKVLNAIALPEVNVGSVTLSASVAAGRLKIEKLSTKGADLEMIADGGVRLRDPVGASLFDLNLRFKFSDAYRGKSETTRALLGEPGSKTPALFDLTPQVQKSKRPDGYYGWRITGTLDRPVFEPSAGAGAAGMYSPVGAAPEMMGTQLPSP